MQAECVWNRQGALMPVSGCIILSTLIVSLLSFVDVWIAWMQDSVLETATGYLVGVVIRVTHQLLSGISRQMQTMGLM
jgi:hypothetical protein